MNKTDTMLPNQGAKEVLGDLMPAASFNARTVLPWITGLAILAVPLFSSSTFYVHLAVMICLNIVIVNGLSILNRTGQLSFCHAAFTGLGAYASVLAATRLGMPFLASAAVGATAAALGAYLLGSIVLRLRGVYFVLITFAFGELFRLALLEGGNLTGGANGLSGIPPIALLGVVFDTKKSFYCLAAILAVLSVAFVVVLFRTPKGHALDAVGENASLAEASGISIRKTQLFAFTVGSALAGIGGVFLARYVGYVSPESFATHVSIAIIIMLVVGGRTSVYGPVIGAFVMTPLPELFRGAVQTQNIFYGVCLIAILRFLPEGLASLRGAIANRLAAHGGSK